MQGRHYRGIQELAILNVVLVTKPHDLQELVNSESRVMLLYSTREEAIHILTAARDLFKITGENYVWVVTQSVIENLQTPYQFPVGMLVNWSLYSRPDFWHELNMDVLSMTFALEDTEKNIY
uniref:Uncharacterized protein n=1 Tax=Timema shepardi TaxID=629360 RepID=A0A7R9FZ28_TIMSH|nr:unnamed protein product [Timema shepardi]